MIWFKKLLSVGKVPDISSGFKKLVFQGNLPVYLNPFASYFILLRHNLYPFPQSLCICQHGYLACGSTSAHFYSIDLIQKSSTMKTQKNPIIHAMNTIIALAMLFIIESCGSKAQDSETANSEVPTVKAPDVDIHTAVLTNNLDALRQHLQAGTNINEKDPFGGSSPLISAAVFGKPEAAKILIDAGADVNFQNNDGSTPLHTASFFCRPEIVAMLLKKNADKSIKNKYGATAYESVAAPYNDVKSSYEMMEKVLGPMGLKLDYAYIEKTRPEIAALLK
jgi:hypothetical protein